MDAQPIRRKRTEEERRRRHLYGDTGARFSARKMEVGTGGVMSAITTVYDKDNIIAEIMYDTTNNEANTREVLCLLRKEIGEEAFLQKMGRLESILKEEVLRQGMHEESICKDGGAESGLLSGTPLFKEDSVYGGKSGEEMRDVRVDKECGCPSQGRELSEQYTRELDACLSQLPYETPQAKEIVQYLRSACETPRSMRETLSALEEIRRPESQAVEHLPKKRYRIRKLTPVECLRLMNVSEPDIKKMTSCGISESQIYKMAGNSIVVACMVGIFTNLFSTETIEQEQLTLF